MNGGSLGQLPLSPGREVTPAAPPWCSLSFLGAEGGGDCIGTVLPWQAWLLAAALAAADSIPEYISPK